MGQFDDLGLYVTYMEVGKNKWQLGYKAALIGLIAFSLYFGTPFVGVITFRSFVQDTLGCEIPFDYVKPCLVYGYDVASKFR